MNGVHDMGGMHGMGAIEHEKNEPVFHASWEGRIYALTRLLRAGGGKSNLDASRHAIELLPAAEYLRMSYYEKWVARMLGQVVTMGVATAAEVESGQPAPGSAKATPPLTAAMVPAMITRRTGVEAHPRSTHKVDASQFAIAFWHSHAAVTDVHPHCLRLLPGGQLLHNCAARFG